MKRFPIYSVICHKLGIYLLGMIFLTGCFSKSDPSSNEQAIVSAPRVRKDNQKIANLQKKLELALQIEKRAKSEVERLDLEIHQAELALIRKCVDEYQKQITDPKKFHYLAHLEASGLFTKERETLHKIIQDGPSSSSFEAQMELDRILRMITEIGDNTRR
ncbi:MAG: hypothetical protein V4487_00250 [Chlamydiota bacterium]